jgi:hypothetical protein
VELADRQIIDTGPRVVPAPHLSDGASFSALGKDLPSVRFGARDGIALHLFCQSLQRSCECRSVFAMDSFMGLPLCFRRLESLLMS